MVCERTVHSTKNTIQLCQCLLKSCIFGILKNCPECGPGQVSNPTTNQCECSEGYGWNALHKICKECKPKTFKPTSGNTPCLPCPATLRQGTIDPTDCECPIGTGLDENSDCLSCENGYITNGLCKACPINSVPEDPNTSCKKCEANSYALPWSRMCLTCDGGVRPLSSPTCEKCAIGKYLDKSTPTWECKPCNRGEQQNEMGKESCKQCSFGKFSENGGAYCDSCPRGYYQDAFGQSDCKMCSGKFYAEGQETIRCRVCEVEATPVDKGSGNVYCSKEIFGV